MQTIRDRQAKTIEPGQTLKRVVEGHGVAIGHIYKVIQRNWKDGGPGEDLVADGGFQKELLWPERAKEYEIVNESL